MTKKRSNDDKNSFRNRLIQALLEDPTRSLRDLSRALGSYRQKVWRLRRSLEEGHAIWGYTAVLDEYRLGRVMYLVLMKMRPMDARLAELIIRRQVAGEFHKQQVRLLDVLYVNGEYDWVVMFSAPDHATARRYYDSIRSAYADFLIDRPHIVDVNFALMREGKRNPELGRLREFVPV